VGVGNEGGEEVPGKKRKLVIEDDIQDDYGGSVNNDSSAMVPPCVPDYSQSPC